jgi:hypothetical protein
MNTSPCQLLFSVLRQLQESKADMEVSSWESNMTTTPEDKSAARKQAPQ